MLVVVAYDIVDDARRLHVAGELENFGQRIQKSIFECYLEDDEITLLKHRLQPLIDPSTDHVRFYRICKKDRDRVLVKGCGTISKDDDYFML